MTHTRFRANSSPWNDSSISRDSPSGIVDLEQQSTPKPAATIPLATSCLDREGRSEEQQLCTPLESPNARNSQLTYAVAWVLLTDVLGSAELVRQLPSRQWSMCSMLSSSNHELLLHLCLDLGTIEAVVDLHSTISLSRHWWRRGSVRIQDRRLLVVPRWIVAHCFAWYSHKLFVVLLQEPGRQGLWLIKELH